MELSAGVEAMDQIEEWEYCAQGKKVRMMYINIKSFM